MKKRLILLFVFMTILHPNIVKGIETADLTMTKIENTFFEMSKDNFYESQGHYSYDFNDNIAYCIEPGIDITDYEYIVSEDLSISNLSNETLEKIFLYAYYGYGYKNHNTINYRIATQQLIWNETTDYNFVFNTQRYGNGTPLDYTEYINEIKSIVDNHYTLPSFSNKTISVEAGKEITLVDTNNVLELYEVVTNNDILIKKNENVLTLTAQITGNIKLEFVKKSEIKNNPVIFFKNNSQKMIGRSNISDVTFSLSLNSVAGKFELYKKDFDNNTNIASGDASLKNAVYGIYNTNDELIETITTDIKGYAISNNLPYFGAYYIKELKTPIGYKLDYTKYYFYTNIENPSAKLEVKEKVIKNEFEIIKVFASNETGTLRPEPNVEFSVYDLDNNLIFSKYTDKNGSIIFELPYGEYIIKQTSTTYNFGKIEDFKVSVTKVKDKTTYCFGNAEISSYLKVNKIDSKTKERIKIKGIKFKIYDLENEKYICQNISYPTNQTICEYTTDENGSFITPSPLKPGKYRLEEFDQYINGYTWNKNFINFEINEDINYTFDERLGFVLEMNFENVEVLGQINIHKKGEFLINNKNNISYDYYPLHNVKFSLYAKEDIYNASGKLVYKTNEFIKYKLTDIYGNLSFDDLLLGKYYILEESKDDIYQNISEPINVKLEYKDQYTDLIIENVNVINYLKKGKLTINKISSETKESLSETYFEIYNIDNELIYKNKTNEFGNLIINDIPYGKYYIIETKPSYGYLLTSEKYYFSINDKNKNENITVENKPVHVKVNNIPDTYKNSNIIYYFGLFNLTLGIIYIYAIKKNN